MTNPLDTPLYKPTGGYKTVRDLINDHEVKQMMDNPSLENIIAAGLNIKNYLDKVEKGTRSYNKEIVLPRLAACKCAIAIQIGDTKRAIKEAILASTFDVPNCEETRQPAKNMLIKDQTTTVYVTVPTIQRKVYSLTANCSREELFQHVMKAAQHGELPYLPLELVKDADNAGITETPDIHGDYQQSFVYGDADLTDPIDLPSKNFQTAFIWARLHCGENYFPNIGDQCNNTEGIVITKYASPDVRESDPTANPYPGYVFEKSGKKYEILIVFKE